MEKKEHERICVERFLKAIGNTAALIEDSEAPDFRVRIDTETVGIEVTKSLRFGERGPNTPQAQASLAAKVMNQARSLYDATGAPQLHVSAGFLNHSPLSLSRVSALAQEIADFLQIRTPEFEQYQHEMIEPWQCTDAMPEIHSLHVMRVPTPEHGLWAANGFAMVRPADESDFAAVLARKEKKIASYRSTVSSVWLLVVVELLEAGELVSAADAASPFTVATDFDRVFAFHWLTGRVTEIPGGRCER